VPSQHGVVWLPPQRRSRVLVTRTTMRPVPLMISRFWEFPVHAAP